MTPSFPLLVWPVWRRAVMGRFPRETGYPHSEWTLPLPRWWNPGYWWCALASRTRCLSPSQTAHPQSGFSGATIRHAGKKSPKVIINLVKLSVIELCNVFMQKTWTLKQNKTPNGMCPSGSQPLPKWAFEAAHRTIASALTGVKGKTMLYKICKTVLLFYLLNFSFHLRF